MCSRPQPLPTVPEPKNSPGYNVSERDTWAMQSAKVHFISLEWPRPHSSPLTRTTMVEVVGVGELVGGDQAGPHDVAAVEVLALPRPELARHVPRLLVARREVVEDRVAEDVGGSLGLGDVAPSLADVGAELEFEVHQVRIVRPRDVLVEADHGHPVGMVEDGPLVPGLRDRQDPLALHVVHRGLRIGEQPRADDAGLPEGLDEVLLEAQEVAHLRRPRDRGQELRPVPPEQAGSSCDRADTRSAATSSAASPASAIASTLDRRGEGWP